MEVCHHSLSPESISKLRICSGTGVEGTACCLFLINKSNSVYFLLSSVTGHKVMDHNGVFRRRIGIRFGKYSSIFNHYTFKTV